MRQAFIKSLVECAEQDSRIYLLVADMGYGLVEPFVNKYADRFINVGVAEQNMIGIAAGLALTGKVVFVYSITNFPTLRCLEQIRNDACYHNANVNIVAGSTGLTYGALGSSHHSTEDIAVMRSLPNMKVVAPADKVETGLAVKRMAKGIGACYLRLGQSGQPIIHKTQPDFKIGRSILMQSGEKIALISTGSMLYKTIQATQILSDKKIRPIVLSMHTIKPIDIDAIVVLSKVVDTIITVEEHSQIGGLGSALAEIIADRNLKIKLRRMGIKDRFVYEVGTQEQLLKTNGLSVEDIVREAEYAVR